MGRPQIFEAECERIDIVPGEGIVYILQIAQCPREFQPVSGEHGLIADDAGSGISHREEIFARAGHCVIVDRAHPERNSWPERSSSSPALAWTGLAV